MPKSAPRITREKSNLANSPDPVGRRNDLVRSDLVGFEKPKEMLGMRAKTFSKDTRISLANETRLSDVLNSKKAYSETLKKLPRGALERPNASRYDNSYLSPFAHMDTNRLNSPVKRPAAGGPVDDSGGPTGVKLQMLKMVRDLGTNQDRSDDAALILRELGSDPTKDHVDEHIFLEFYKSVQSTKEIVGEEVLEVRAELRDIFARLTAERDLMTHDVNEMEVEAGLMKGVTDRMRESVVSLENAVGRAKH